MNRVPQNSSRFPVLAIAGPFAGCLPGSMLMLLRTLLQFDAVFMAAGGGVGRGGGWALTMER